MLEKVDQSQGEILIRKTSEKKGDQTNLPEENPHGLTVTQTMFAILSTIVGGSYVGIPFSMYNMGLLISLGVFTLAMLN